MKLFVLGALFGVVTCGLALATILLAAAACRATAGGP